jgi:hypothetical protein
MIVVETNLLRAFRLSMETKVDGYNWEAVASVLGRSFTGCELAQTEKRPRMQSRVDLARLRQGNPGVFAARNRPESGTKGKLRHSLRDRENRIRCATAPNLGMIFHDAR